MKIPTFLIGTIVLLSSSVFAQSPRITQGGSDVPIESLSNVLRKYGSWSRAQTSYTFVAGYTDRCTLEYSVIGRLELSPRTGRVPGGHTFRDETSIYAAADPSHFNVSRFTRSIDLSNLNVKGLMMQESKFRDVVEIIVPLIVPEEPDYSPTGLPVGVKRTTVLFSVERKGADRVRRSLINSVNSCTSD